MPSSPASKRWVALAATLTLAGAVAAAYVLPKALPLISLGPLASRAAVLRQAGDFVRAHDVYDAGARTAVRFVATDSLRTFIELAGGGKDSLDAVVRRGDVAVFAWLVRFFEPRNPREAVVQLSPDGRVIGFRRTLADSDARPLLTADSARALAERVVREWTGRRLEAYRLQASSYETKMPSGRVDRTFTYERTDRTIAGAPLRLDVVVAGDLPSRVREYVVIPESFSRRYGEMRAWNDFLALAAGVGLIGFALIALGALIRYGRAGRLRWRPALAVGAVIGGLLAAAALNDLPGSWFGYDTATSPATFFSFQVASALLTGIAMTVFVGGTLAAAEALTRNAFPWHLDWWRLWKYRGTREVAGRVFGGYALAVVGFLYIGVFYYATRRWLGWWVPSELLDDPNQIATPLPWLAGLAVAAQAGVWEEALFRAVPLAALSLWVGDRPRRRLYMALGVIVTAVAFGFAHSNYPSWPPYSRGVELFLEASLWAAVFIRFGLIVTVIAHFLFDLTLFGVFAAAGDAPAYRVTLAIIIACLLAPAAAVAAAWVKRRALVPADADARFAAWNPAPPRPLEPPITIGRRSLTPTSRLVATIVCVAGLVTIVASALRPPLGPPFTASRARATAVADSTLRTRGVDPRGWHALAVVETYRGGAAERFLRRYHAAAQARALATTYRPAAAWLVRYVHPTAALAQRTEEWTVRLLPDGRLWGLIHVVPQDAPGAWLEPDSARHLARTALASLGIDTLRLREVELRQTPRPRREDSSLEYVDTTVRLPAAATARARVELAGATPVGVRRFLQLPESFLRDDRADAEDRSVVALVAALLLVGATAAGTIWIVRRRQPAMRGAVLGRRAAVAALAGMALVQLAVSLNEWPTLAAGYDTAQPWSTFIAASTIQIIVSAVVFALFVMGALNASSAVRRRVGIPFWPDAGRSGGARDALLGGTALALLPVAASAAALAAPNDIPSAPETALGALVPVLAPALDLVRMALLVPTLLALPLLVLIAFAHRRVVWIAIPLAAAAVAASVGPASDIAVAGGVWTVAALALVAIGLWLRAFWVWGSGSALAWLFAALVAGAANSLGMLVGTAAPQDRLAGGVGVLVAAVSIAWLYRLAERRDPGPAVEEAPTS